MTTPRRPRRSAPVRALLATGPALILLVAGFAAPASADVPEGWSNPPSINPIHAFLVVGGLPLLLIALIVAFVYLPSLIRGEDVAPAGTPPGPDQWLGGPRRGTAELAGPDGDESKAGGARGTW